MNEPFVGGSGFPAPTLSAEERVERMRQFYATLNRGDMEGALKFVAPDFLEHMGEEQRGGPAVGREPFLQARLDTRARLVNVEVTMHHTTAIDPDLLLVIAEIQGDQWEDGRQVRWRAASVIRFNAEGLMSEHWEYRIQQEGPVAWDKGDAL